jgi:hypothetical protein
MIGTLLIIIGALFGLAAFVCLVLVIVKMFQKQQTGLAIASIILSLCVPFGVLLPLIYGWMKAGEWGIKNLMMAWTGCLVALMIFYCAGFSLTGMAVGTQANMTFQTVGSWPK